ncbi:hypothetical protein MLC35_05265 [Sulfurimonas sp. NW7]|uniref:hypothetical protein n=1 Tax=Sulfurimonas sp. NW7 TaxID=2922727 RepID=UPI003DA7BFD3
MSFWSYLKGGKYDFRSKLYSQRKARREEIALAVKNNNITFDKSNFSQAIDIDNIDALANMKLDALEKGKSSARDVYDLGFIITHKQEVLSSKTTKRFMEKFTNIDFVDFLLVNESVFKGDGILDVGDLFDSILRLKKGIKNIDKEVKKDLT